MIKIKNAIFALLLTMIYGNLAFAASDQDIKALKTELDNIRNIYESRISDLEAKIAKLENKTDEVDSVSNEKGLFSAKRKVYNNKFNPSIGVILNGKFANYSQDASDIKGFGIGEEGTRPSEGLSVDETELNFSASVDDKFKGSMTAAIVREDGSDKIELEEAYVQTLPGIGLPDGMTIKAGRSFWNLGYLNEHHSHTDDFVDRPLPYRVFLNKSFNDDGVEFSYVLPTSFYSEIGGGLFRGDDFPGGGSDGEGASSYSAFARIGGDIGMNQSWRLGASYLNSDVKERLSNEDTISFSGKSKLYAADLRYTFAPIGNPNNKEFALQGEYFFRDEKGEYNTVDYDENSNSWYLQGVYKFHPQFRFGYRYTELESGGTPVGLLGTELDSKGYDPYINSLMFDWNNSEFSLLRFQYNNDKTIEGQTDNQFMLQYIMSFGAHGAHKY